MWWLSAVNGELDQKARVVYIAGEGRSGTTLLSRVLGSFDRCIAVGELYDIWNRSLQGYTLCSCGAPFTSCGFWNAVMCEISRDGEIDFARMVALRRSVQRPYHVPQILFPWLRTPSFKRNLREYVSTTERVYLAIHKVSGCDVIVDSSKLAAYALALTESGRLDIGLIHIARDSRACAYSWCRLRREATIGDQTVFMGRRPVARSALVWTIRNSLLHAIAPRFAFGKLLRYEDLVQRPQEVVSELVERLGIEGESVTWNSIDEMVTTKTHHIFAGNPSRVEQGKIRFRADDEWRSKMPSIQKGIVTALTLPTLWQLGYLGRRAR